MAFASHSAQTHKRVPSEKPHSTKELSMTNIDHLLKQIKLINLQYNALYEKERFNLFSILRNDHDEVHLHSAFITELLNPQGSHGLGEVFLKSFLSELNIPWDSSWKNRDIQVQSERRFFGYGQIDILIKFPQSIIVIENKIRARDQDAQLERYYNSAVSLGCKAEDINFFYLCLERTDPSPVSLGNLKLSDVQCISYSQEIIRWLAQCVREASLAPALRESIVQYSNLINKLTGNTMSQKNRNEVVALLCSGDNAKTARTILDAWNELRWHVAGKFWRDLEQQLEQLRSTYTAYEVLPIEKYTNRGGDESGIGVFARLCYLPNTAGDALVLGIQNAAKSDPKGTELFVGFVIVRNGQVLIGNDDPLRKEWELTGIFPKGQRTDRWLGWKYFSSRAINLQNFINDDTLALANDQERQVVIQDLLREIKNLIDACLASKKQTEPSQLSGAT
jgi:hypothetical protein